MSRERVYNKGDLVFARVRGYPPWPGQIEAVFPEKKCDVFFFGSYDQCTVHIKDIFPYTEYKAQFGKRNNRKDFNQALIEIKNKEGEFLKNAQKKTQENNSPVKTDSEKRIIRKRKWVAKTTMPFADEPQGKRNCATAQPAESTSRVSVAKTEQADVVGDDIKTDVPTRQSLRRRVPKALDPDFQSPFRRINRRRTTQSHETPSSVDDNSSTQDSVQASSDDSATHENVNSLADDSDHELVIDEGAAKTRADESTNKSDNEIQNESAIEPLNKDIQKVPDACLEKTSQQEIEDSPILNNLEDSNVAKKITAATSATSDNTESAVKSSPGVKQAATIVSRSGRVIKLKRFSSSEEEMSDSDNEQEAIWRSPMRRRASVEASPVVMKQEFASTVQDADVNSEKPDEPAESEVSSTLDNNENSSSESLTSSSHKPAQMSEDTDRPVYVDVLQSTKHTTIDASKKPAFARLQRKVAEKEQEKERLKREKLERKRMIKAETLRKKAMLSETIDELDATIRRCLDVNGTMDVLSALKALSALSQLEIPLDVLLQHRNMMITLKKCRLFKFDVEVRHASSTLYERHRTFILNNALPKQETGTNVKKASNSNSTASSVADENSNPEVKPQERIGESTTVAPPLHVKVIDLKDLKKEVGTNRVDEVISKEPSLSSEKASRDLRESSRNIDDANLVVVKQESDVALDLKDDNTTVKDSVLDDAVDVTVSNKNDDISENDDSESRVIINKVGVEKNVGEEIGSTKADQAATPGMDSQTRDCEPDKNEIKCDKSEDEIGDEKNESNLLNDSSGSIPPLEAVPRNFGLSQESEVSPDKV